MLDLLWATTAGFSVNTAHGGVPDAARDPMRMDPELFTGKRLRFIHSPADTIVTKADNTDDFRTRISPYAEEYGLIVSSGEHGDASSFQPTDVVNYFTRTVVPEVATPPLYLFRS
jgi:hypothetical protein